MKTMACTVVLVLAATLLAHAQNRNRRDNAPKVGQPAPDFKAKKIGKKEFVVLSKAVREAKKPAVLIFGSYT